MPLLHREPELPAHHSSIWVLADCMPIKDSIKEFKLTQGFEIICVLAVLIEVVVREIELPCESSLPRRVWANDYNHNRTSSVVTMIVLCWSPCNQSRGFCRMSLPLLASLKVVSYLPTMPTSNSLIAYDLFWIVRVSRGIHIL